MTIVVFFRELSFQLLGLDHSVFYGVKNVIMVVVCFFLCEAMFSHVLRFPFHSSTEEGCIGLPIFDKTSKLGWVA